VGTDEREVQDGVAALEEALDHMTSDESGSGGAEDGRVGL